MQKQLPFYNQSNLHLLQEEADELEGLGVIAKPEDVGLDVKFALPSFLVKKPSGGYRFVTAFNELGQYARIFPTVSNSCDDVLRKLSSWKYIIRSDLTKSFFQIPVSKSSILYLGTVTLFKGLRVYMHYALGMSGSSEHLQGLTSPVLEDLIQEGFVIVIADDLHVCSNTVPEIFHNWSLVLHHMHQNNPKLYHMHENNPKLYHMHENNPKLYHMHENNPKLYHMHENNPKLYHMHENNPNLYFIICMRTILTCTLSYA